MNTTFVSLVLLNILGFSLQLTPIISDPEYLLDQHILISIKSSDSDESYGKPLSQRLVHESISTYS